MWVSRISSGEGLEAAKSDLPRGGRISAADGQGTRPPALALPCVSRLMTFGLNLNSRPSLVSAWLPQARQPLRECEPNLYNESL